MYARGSNNIIAFLTAGFRFKTSTCISFVTYLYNTNQCRERTIIEIGKFCDKTIMYKIYRITMRTCHETQKPDPVPAQKMRTLDPDTAAHRHIVKWILIYVLVVCCPIWAHFRNPREISVHEHFSKHYVLKFQFWGILPLLSLFEDELYPGTVIRSVAFRDLTIVNIGNGR